MDKRKIANITALLILLAMFILMFFSSLNESAIMDELAHIPAGYSYLTQKDYRLNPEHPPLAKDLAAFPLIFLNLNFPTEVKAWAEDINGQWDMGRIFLYESGNDADRILFWSRLPMMILALVFGWLIFYVSRRLYGDRVGLLTLLFYASSPTFVAHSRYVTTDLAAAFGFFIAITVLVRYLESPSPRRLMFCGIVLGIALLMKFSLALLIPFYVLIYFLRVFLNKEDGSLFYGWLKASFNLLITFALSGLVIAAIYQFHVWNYPTERQITDTLFNLSSFGFRPAADSVSFMASQPVLRGLGQYFLGLLMVIQRAAGGNTAYLFGEVSSNGWWYYFPAAYLLKEPLAFLILTLIAVFVALKSTLGAKSKSLSIALEWMRDNFFLTAGILFIAIYWLQSMRSPLNIGIRHVLPTYPFIYLLVSRELMRWLRSYSLYEPRSIGEWIYLLYEKYVKSLPKYFVLSLLGLWMVLGAITSFPSYLSYYNELAGGTGRGYKYIVDSNYDWGQDLKRLRDFTQTNKIENIALDYFGGGSPQYYLGEKFTPWWSAKGKPDAKAGDPEWFAVSASFLQSAVAKPAKGFTKKPEDSYLWLEGLTPHARAGRSIFIYKF